MARCVLPTKMEFVIRGFEFDLQYTPPPLLVVVLLMVQFVIEGEEFEVQYTPPLKFPVMIQLVIEGEDFSQ